MFFSAWFRNDKHLKHQNLKKRIASIVELDREDLKSTRPLTGAKGSHDSHLNK
ncbi:hypothetical protein ACFORL_00765 [Legionella dresdenensis]|uniref:Uncharacterized protein n=1 Tax=Legionella dresdenensis TaxID=450200 RepID=A0ABV8CBD4_9GAMM